MAAPLAPADLRHVLDHTAHLWNDLKGARIFITGGTGFFGCWLLETLVAADKEFNLGLEAVVLTRSPAAFLEKMPHLAGTPVTLHPGDVRHFDFPEGRFTHVLHAGTTSSSPVPPAEMLGTIVEGTRRTLEFAVQCGVKSFLFISSGAVYGSQPEGMDRIPESYRADPASGDSAYTEGKRAAESLCAAHQREHGLPIKIARCFAFVGPHLPLDAHFAIGNFIRDALKGGPISITGDGTSVRSYLYAADLSIALWTLLLKGAPGSCLNIGSEEAFPMSALAGIVADTLAPGCPVHITGLPHTGPVHRYVPDCSRARKELDLQPLIPLPEGIRRTAEWVRRSASGKEIPA